MDWLWNFDDMARYGGWDFLGMALTFTSLLLLGRRRRVGFLVGALANAAWLVFAWKSRSAATVFANVLFGGMNLWVWVRWKSVPSDGPVLSPPARP